MEPELITLKSEEVVCSTTYAEDCYFLMFYDLDLNPIKTVTIECEEGKTTFVHASDYVYIVIITAEPDRLVYNIYAFESTIENINSFGESATNFQIFYYENKIVTTIDSRTYIYNGAKSVAMALIPTALDKKLFIPFFEIVQLNCTFVNPTTKDGIKYIYLGCYDEMHAYINKNEFILCYH